METGGALLRDVLGRLARHWPALVALAATGLLARELLLELAVRAGRLTAVTGLLVLSLVPLASLLVFVAMLLVMRPSTIPPGRRVRRVLAVMASLIVPYLVVYEHYGTLDADQRTFYYESSRDAFDQAMSTGAEAGSRVPEAASLAVLGTVAGALLARSLVRRILKRRRLGGDDSLRRTALQVVLGYAEVVWIFLGVFVVTLVSTAAFGWLGSRVATDRVRRWWDGFTARFEMWGDVAALLSPAGSLLVTGVLVGLVVPVSWLCFGAVVYGSQPVELAVTVGQRPDGRAARVVDGLRRRIGDDAVDRAYRATVDTERRFGPLMAGLAMIRGAGLPAVMWFCLVYVVLGQLGYAVWGVARWIVGPEPLGVWSALATPLNAVTTIAVQVAAAALLAAAADALVRAMATRTGSAAQAPSVAAPAQPVGSVQ